MNKFRSYSTLKSTLSDDPSICSLEVASLNYSDCSKALLAKNWDNNGNGQDPSDHLPQMVNPHSPNETVSPDQSRKQTEINDRGVSPALLTTLRLPPLSKRALIN